MKHLKLKTVSLQFVIMVMVAMSAAPVYAAPATAAPAHEFFTVDEDNLESDTTRRNEYSFMEYSP
ncbi:hypothetical protein [Bdellovibrio bacteriovorus]|uniref:hypothetical protein n=1 Tax=Bdellovibrio bacteriovorus TaxID=959 RepID=UPI0035A5C90F